MKLAVHPRASVRPDCRRRGVYSTVRSFLPIRLKFSASELPGLAVVAVIDSLQESNA